MSRSRLVFLAVNCWALAVTALRSASMVWLQTLPPENLRLQYEVLSALWQHLQASTAGVRTPEQFFIAHSPADDVYILVQEYMAGWMQVKDRTRQYYDKAGESDIECIRLNIKAWTSTVRDRLRVALTGFPLAHMLDDLALERESGIHGGNLLVPAGATFDAATPLCIIDQPGREQRKSNIAKESS